jgi:hypothetical protein
VRAEEKLGVHNHDARLVRNRSVAVQVEIESETLKPGDHISGSRVETRRFQPQGHSYIQLVPRPHRCGVVRAHAGREVVLQPRDAVPRQPLGAGRYRC